MEFKYVNEQEKVELSFIAGKILFCVNGCEIIETKASKMCENRRRRDWLEAKSGF